MKTKNFLMVALIVFFLSSCNKDEPVGPLPDNFYPNSYILEFTNPSNLLSSADHCIRLDREKKLFRNSYTETEDPSVINIRLDLADFREERISFDAPRKSLNYETYMQKISQLGDNKFYGYSQLYSRDHILGYKSGLVLNDTISNISVSCNKEYLGVPAGNNLEDKFMIFYEDLLLVVKNGYKKPTGERFYSIPNETAFPYALIGEPLAVFNQDEHPNISPSMILYANNLPATEAVHTFNINVIMKSGKVYTTQCQL